MNEVELRLKHAIAFNLDPKVVSPSGTWFAWYPVKRWDHVLRKRRTFWLERVKWFCPLGLIYEYSSIEQKGRPSKTIKEHIVHFWIGVFILLGIWDTTQPRKKK